MELTGCGVLDKDRRLADNFGAYFTLSHSRRSSVADMATRAHTVPRFYLGGFAAPESEGTADPFVWLGSLTTGEVKRRSPKNISIVRGLYDGRKSCRSSKPLAKVGNRAWMECCGNTWLATRVEDVKANPAVGRTAA